MNQEAATEAPAPEARRASVGPYLWLLAAILGLGVLSYGAGDAILQRFRELEDSPTASVLAGVVLFGACSFASHYATWKTSLPSFVAAIALGMAGHTLFGPIVSNSQVLASLVTGGAAVILFGGGLEMPFRHFMRLIVKILLLALPGVLITGFALSAATGGVGRALSFPLASAVLILLGAILASTDPAAIIPVLEPMRFKRRDAKDIVIAESALNDVVGTLLTSAFFKLPLVGLGLVAAYRSLASGATLQFLAVQAGYGALFGLVGYGLLWVLSRMKKSHGANFGPDLVYFTATPIFAFVGAALLGGSGFLAAFVAGLLFHAEEHLAEIERFFFQIVDGVAKPVIFVMVGALVDVRALVTYAPVGIAAALLFMFVIRPAMVLLMIGPFALVRDAGQRLSLRELLFISFVRETGAIPAVLLVSAVGRVTFPIPGLIEIGMWVILLTLLIAPPLTPLVARRLRVAE